ncbi:hypothetical protein BC830DRAFT_1148666 [Chytriomyces sp. MP71]|nr:hypothetical protein BC830DRAFT_1148666 [Chytriomyces sp. MP71]
MVVTSKGNIPTISAEPGDSPLKLVKVKASYLKEIPPPLAHLGRTKSPIQTAIAAEERNFDQYPKFRDRARSKSDISFEQISSSLLGDEARARRRAQSNDASPSLLDHKVTAISQSANHESRPMTSIMARHHSNSELDPPIRTPPVVAKTAHMIVKPEPKVVEKSSHKNEKAVDKPVFKTSRQIVKVDDEPDLIEKFNKLTGGEPRMAMAKPKKSDEPGRRSRSTASKSISPNNTTVWRSQSTPPTSTRKSLVSSPMDEHTNFFPGVLEETPEETWAFPLVQDEETSEAKLERLRRNLEQARWLYEAEKRKSLALVTSTEPYDDLNEEGKYAYEPAGLREPFGPIPNEIDLAQSQEPTHFLVQVENNDNARVRRHQDSLTNYPIQYDDIRSVESHVTQPIHNENDCSTVETQFLSSPLKPPQFRPVVHAKPDVLLPLAAANTTGSGYLQQFLLKKQQNPSIASDPASHFKLSRLSKPRDHGYGIDIPVVPRFIVEDCKEPNNAGYGGRAAHPYIPHLRKLKTAEPLVTQEPPAKVRMSHSIVPSWRIQTPRRLPPPPSTPPPSQLVRHKPALKPLGTPKTREKVTLKPSARTSKAKNASSRNVTGKTARRTVTASVAGGKRITFAKHPEESPEAPASVKKAPSNGNGGAVVKLPKISPKSAISTAQKSGAFNGANSVGNQNQLVQAQYQWLMQQAQISGAAGAKGGNLFGNATVGNKGSQVGKGSAIATGSIPAHFVPAKFRLTQVPVVTMKPIIVIETSGQTPGTYFDGLTTFISMEGAQTKKGGTQGPPSHKRNRARK